MVLLIALVTGGCAQHATKLCEPLEQVYAGRGLEAIESLDSSSVAKSNRDRLLYHADRGLLLHLTGQYAESSRELEIAVAICDELEPNSITATLTDYTVNEAVKEYVGEDYERAYLHYYLALNYLMQDDLVGAAVECRRLDDLLAKLDARYEDDDRYQDDGFIRYLSGMIFEARGKLNDAFVDYKAAFRSYTGDMLPRTGVSVPEGLRISMANVGRALGLESQVRNLLGSVPVEAPTTGARVVVVIDNGWAPYKREESIDLPIYRPMVPDELKGSSLLAARVKIAFPVFVSPAVTTHRFTVEMTPLGSAAPRETAPAEKAQDMDRLAKWALERRIGAIKLRSTFRATAKAVALAKQKADAAKRSQPTSGWGKLLRAVAEDLVTVAVAETEQADTRSWLLLPAEMYIARLDVEPGSYRLAVRPGYGTPLDLGTVDVGPGKTVFRSCRYFGAPHPIHCEN